MAEFTLPSGRMVDTREPPFGEYVKLATRTGLDAESTLYAKFALIVPGLTREEVEVLPGSDGLALMREVERIWQGRSKKAKVPLDNGGVPSSIPASDLLK